MAVRRSIVLDVGGFHPDIYGQIMLGDGETGLIKDIQNAGWDLYYSPDAYLWHVIPKQRLTLEYFRLRYSNQGASDSYTIYHVGVPKRHRLLSEMIYRGVKSVAHLFLSWILRAMNKPGKYKHIFRTSYEVARSKYAFRLIYDRKFRELVLRKNWFLQ